MGRRSFVVILLAALSGPATASDWHFGGYLESAYLGDLNSPDNHLFRGRATTPRVDEPDVNFANAYVRKDATESSRWGLALGAQSGLGTDAFATSATSANIDGFDFLRHVAAANMSYLAPVGRGLTLQAGIFDSVIGYEQLYARYNPNYTRTWIGDESPYLMMGVGASYPISNSLAATALVLNHYAHLSHPNDAPSYCGQLAWAAAPRVSVKETVFAGPDQSDTSTQYWRYFSDSIVEYKTGPFTAAFSYDAGTERVIGASTALWMGGAIFTSWNVSGPWSLAVRPEFYWDRDGRLTGSPQLIRGVTTTVEYKRPAGWTNAAIRLEHRWDESTGPGGGFFSGAGSSLTADQHLFIAALLLTFDSP